MSAWAAAPGKPRTGTGNREARAFPDDARGSGGDEPAVGARASERPPVLAGASQTDARAGADGRTAPQTAILDAGVGNLRSVQRALQAVGCAAAITADPGDLAGADRIVLPGVGAFRPPREALRGRLESALRDALARGAWLLGICVGFQLLFEQGEEFGTTDGLRLFGGAVTSLPEGVTLPHIGWNRLALEAPGHPLFAGVENGAYVYFVHSFAPEHTPADQVLATALHGRRFPAVAGRGRVFGTQFHPEKSGAVGLRLLANFLRLSAEGGARGAAAGD